MLEILSDTSKKHKQKLLYQAMTVNENELLYSSVVNAGAWGGPMGLFVLKMGFNHPTLKQLTLSYLISAACFSLIGCTTHYFLSRIYQNQADENTSVNHRALRILTSTLMTPLTAVTSFVILTQVSRGARQHSYIILKNCTQSTALVVFFISAIAVHILFSYIYSSGEKKTPLLSQKTYTRLVASSIISGSITFFATCFSII